MLSVENSKIGDRMLILMARFSPEYTQDILIPEIEASCIQFHVDPPLVENFQKNKFAVNSMYFHHCHAYADIPNGQEYEYIARMSKGAIVPDSISRCKATVLAFFTGFKTIPHRYANHGHHENSLIQFQDGIPDMILSLNEITDQTTFLEYTPDICLCSLETLKANIAALEM